MRKVVIFLLVFLVLLLAPTLIRYIQFYQPGGGEVTAPPVYDSKIIAEASQAPIPAASDFVDAPTVGQGDVLLDMAHANSFTLEEIAYLDGRLAARGFEMIPYRSGDLATLLRGVNAFIAIAPLSPYTPQEVQAVREFVDRGGRLLMVGDPTRFQVSFIETDFSFTYNIEKNDMPLNMLANSFSLAFNGDYLYNTVENEGNFRNIILKDSAFVENKLTDELAQIAFYSAHSLQVGPDATALLLADDNTWSSATDRPGGLVLAATSMNGRVLALGDIHFMMEPYYTVFDNGRFIAHIADFLTEVSSRGFVLADFPYFYRGPIDLIYTDQPDLGPDAFDEIIALQNAFRRVGRDLQLALTPDPDHDALFLGLYNQSADVADILASAGITLTIDPPILPTEETDAADADAPLADEPPTDVTHLIQTGWGTVQMPGTALILLHEADGQRQVVILAASKVGLENTVSRILDLIPLNADYALSGCLIQGDLALCPTNVAHEVVEAELLTSEQPEQNGNGGGTTTPGNGDIGGGYEPPVDAVVQGVIGLDDTVSGRLAEAESHAWVFKEGPAIIDISLASDDLDSVLELYGPDGAFIMSADSGLTGDPEMLTAVALEDDGEYTIVVRDYWGEAGAYTLSVTAASNSSSGGGNRIFILGDDDGEALNGGILSVDFFTSRLPADSDVTVWISSVDGRLPANALDGVSLLIWDTGDYLDDAGLLDTDTEIIFDYLDSDTGNVLMVGSVPALFSYLETSPLADVVVTGDDPTLLNGLQAGDVIALDQIYEAVLPDFSDEDIAEGEVVFLLRGAASDSPGAVAAAVAAQTFLAQKTAVVLFPFTALPLTTRDVLFANLLDWFALN